MKNTRTHGVDGVTVTDVEKRKKNVHRLQLQGPDFDATLSFLFLGTIISALFPLHL